MQQFTITKNESGRRIDRLIKEKFPHLPLGKIFSLFRKSDIKINQKRCKDPSQKVNYQDQITIYISDTIEKKSPPKSNVSKKFYEKNFHPIYEDQHILIVNKPPLIAVHPGTNHNHGKTMIDLANYHIINSPSPPTDPFIQLAHRLDADTSGALLFAKDAQTLRKINEMIKQRKIEKKYFALVYGIITENQKTIQLPLERITNSRYTKVQAHTTPSPHQNKNIKLSKTHFQVIKRYDYPATLIDVNLETGRMHQIRVHMMSQSHPLILDQMYGDFSKNKIFQKTIGLKRQFLHAHSLKFIHPITKQKLNITAPLPPDLETTLTQLKK